MEALNLEFASEARKHSRDIRALIRVCEIHADKNVVATQRFIGDEIRMSSAL